jgi:hypothetical protein
MMERMEATYGFRLPHFLSPRPWPFQSVFAILTSHEESGFLTPHALYIEGGPGSGATAVLAHAQQENKALMDLANPFSPASLSGRVVAEAIALAERHDQFRQNFYYPVVKARMALATQLRENDLIKTSGDGTTEHRGKRPKPRVKKQPKK